MRTTWILLVMVCMTSGAPQSGLNLLTRWLPSWFQRASDTDFTSTQNREQQNNKFNRAPQNNFFNPQRAPQDAQFTQQRETFSNQDRQFSQQRPSQDNQFNQQRPSQDNQFSQQRPSQDNQFSQQRPSRDNQFNQQRPSRDNQFNQQQQDSFIPQQTEQVIQQGVLQDHQQNNLFIQQSPIVPNSPCPQLFRYDKSPSGEWLGVVTITPTLDYSSRNQTINLQLSMVLGARLPSQYVGQIALRDSKESVLAQIANGRNTPIVYYVYFPSQNPLPRIGTVQVNDVTLCYDNPDVGQSRTTLTLRHSFFAFLNFVEPQRPQQTRPTSFIPPNTTPSYWQPPQQNFPTARPPPQTFAPTRPPPPVTMAPVEQVQQFALSENCGRATLQAASQLVVHGQSVSESGVWPWLTAIFRNSKDGLKFHCGGSLISNKLVVTAAHCVKLPQLNTMSVESLIVYAGKFNLRKWSEPSQPRELRKIIVHEKYATGAEGKLDNDLAILVLDTPVEFSITVQPICVWSPNTPNQLFASGTVVGWGRDENDNVETDEPKSVTMPVVSQEECLRSHPDFFHLTSPNTYCAGSRNGSGPCNGDSGGGMYVVEDRPGYSKRWMLRGVVSLSKVKSGRCDPFHYVIFTDVVKLLPWIQNVMKSYT